MALRALVVDDSRVARSAVSRTFQKLGCEVVGLAADGIEAVELYKKLKPDFVSLDLVMPKMGGQETLKAIRGFDPTAVVIVVSSLAMKDVVVECVRAGAANYLVKPFKEEKVASVLSKCFPDINLRGDFADSAVIG